MNDSSRWAVSPCGFAGILRKIPLDSSAEPVHDQALSSRWAWILPMLAVLGGENGGRRWAQVLRSSYVRAQHSWTPLGFAKWCAEPAKFGLRAKVEKIKNKYATNSFRVMQSLPVDGETGIQNGSGYIHNESAFGFVVAPLQDAELELLPDDMAEQVTWLPLLPEDGRGASAGGALGPTRQMTELLELLKHSAKLPSRVVRVT